MNLSLIHIFIMQGVQGLMEDICTYFPHPKSHGRFSMADDVTVRIDETKPPCAFAFKTVSDPFVGRLTFLKVLSDVYKRQAVSCSRQPRRFPRTRAQARVLFRGSA